MPVIPTYQRRETITSEAPSIPSNVGSGNLVGQQIENVGQAITQIGNVALSRRKEYERLEEIARRENEARLEKMRRIDNANKLLEISTTVDDEARNLLLSESQKTGPDTYGNIERANEKYKALESSVLADIKDPELAVGVRQHLNSSRTNILNHFAGIQAKARIEETKTVREKVFNSVNVDVQTGVIDLEQGKNRLAEVIKTQVAVGAISPDAAEDTLLEGRRDLVANYLEGKLRDDPQAAIKEIKEGVHNVELGAKLVDHYNDKATSKIKELEVDERIAKNEKREEEKEYKSKLNDEANKRLTDLALNKKLTQGAVEAQRNNLAHTDYQQWAANILTLEKKGEKEKDKELPNKLWAKMVEEAKLSDDQQEVNVKYLAKLVMSGDLDAKEARQLATDYSKLQQEQPLKSVAAKAVISKLNQYRKKKIFDEDEKKNIDKHNHYLELFRQYVNNNPEATQEDMEGAINSLLKVEADGFFERALSWFSSEKPKTVKEEEQEIVGTSSAPTMLIERGKTTGKFYVKDPLGNRFEVVKDANGNFIRKQ